MSIAQEPVANWSHPLLRADGTALLGAHEAILKGALESELDIDAIYAPRRVPFEPIFTLQADPAVQRALASHRVRLVDTVDAARAVTLAARAAREGKRAMALVPNEQLAMGLAVAAREDLKNAPDSGALILLLEDNPYLVRLACPWSAARTLRAPTIGPCDIVTLRDSIEHAARLAHSADRLSIIVAHSLVLRSLDSPEVRPNRVLERVEQAAALRRARRGGRVAETGDLMRLVRRLELNKLTALPSPGEREPVAFIAVGPGVTAVHHILGEFGLEGRVPVVDLGCVQPLDESVLHRILTRCDDAVILEPRPGGVASSIMSHAETIRASGERTARLWWNTLPSVPEGEAPTLDINDGVRPSILLRKILHLLQMVRPGLQHSPSLAPAQPELQAIRTPRRAFGLGPTGALESMRSLLDEAAAAVGKPDNNDPEAPSRALSLEGRPTPSAERVTAVELWDRRQFAGEGAAAILQAAYVDEPRLFVVVDLGGSDDVDVERLANAAIPVVHAPSLHIAHADLNDRPALVSAIADTVRKDGIGVVVAHDGPPARRDIRQLEAALSEADRLGFTPHQRMIWPADVGCEVRPLPQAVLIEKGAERGLDPLKTEFVKQSLPTDERLPIRLEVRALLEQVEVVRTKPPLLRYDADTRVRPPRPLHGREGRWRCHVAGYRSDPPGLAVLALCEAGRAMGYRVQALYHPTPVGPGRRAWGQLLFTSYDIGPDARVHAPQTPYGEADLLMGFDPVETLRAIGPDPYLRVASPDRTYVVANTGAFEDQVVPELADAALRLPRALPLATKADGALLADFVTTARRSFLTDRVADLIVLGAAFQRGFIPVSVEAIEGAMRRLERRGFGRSFEAFEFGRRLAEGQVLPDTDIGRGDSLGRLVRRSALEVESSRFGGTRRARQFRYIVREMIDTLPALYMTAEGRQALRDFVNASVRCVAWGGVRHLRWYAGMVTSLYEAGASDPERKLCTHSILPLAELTLVRDVLYVAAMQAATSHARRIRERLGVRANRGDVMFRRYLNRVEVVLGRTMYRLDLRSSDWPAQLALLLWRVVPNELRGQPHDRRRRALATELFERAANEPHRYAHWVEVAQRLNDLGARHALHDVPEAELETLARQ